jgi:O-antigen/teichoic acid export membrane protein
VASGRSLPANVLANWAGYAVGLVVNFFLSPLVVHHLGPSAYGVWMLLVTLTAYLGLLDLGIRSAVTRYVARSEGGGEATTAAAIVSTALALFAGLAVLATVAATALGLLAPWVFRIPEEHRAATVVVTALVGASTGVALVSGAVGGVLVGLQRFDLLAVTEVTVTLLRAALVLGIVATGGGLVALATAQLLASVAGAALTAWLGLRLYPGLRSRPRWNRAHLGLIASYGGATFVAQLAGSIIDRAGVLVLGAGLPMAAVTVFAIAAGLADYARALLGGIRVTLAPRASALEGGGQRDALGTLALLGTRYCTLLALPIAATFILRGTSFIGLWMGPQYGGPSGAVLAILALRLVAQGATGTAANVMLGAGRQQVVARLLVVEAVVGLAAMVLLVGPHGLSGVAWATAAPTMAAALLAWPWLLRASFGVRILDYAVASWGRPLAATLPFIGATWLVERLWPAPSLLFFIGQTAALLPLALVGIWQVGLLAAERQRAFDLVREVRARAAVG